MSNEANRSILEVSGLSHRYPAKTSFLGQVFRHTTNSYKITWFLGILSLLRKTTRPYFRISDILTEMVVVAWYPICFYRLSLGRQDKLQDVVLNIKVAAGLSASERPNAVREAVIRSPSAQASLLFLKTYVPTRFLTPWVANELRGMKDSKKDAAIRSLIRSRRLSSQQPIYRFLTRDDAEHVELDPAWFGFLRSNLAVIHAFAEHSFALYLQDRNPHVPGIIKKLRVPTSRQLSTAREFWRRVRAEFHVTAKLSEFRDIYADCELGERFAIDHFLPWSFVVHDMLWNLTPVEKTTNSRKSDVVPDIDLYLPRLARLHHRAISTARSHPKFLEDYAECFKQDSASLVTLSEENLLSRYREVILPQAQIAINQGFEYGWRFKG